jgi:hypothetical protein
VVEIWDKALSKRLQLDPDLTLESAKRRVRQREAVHEQQTVLQKPVAIKEEKSLDAVKHFSKRPQRKSHVPATHRSERCTRCGRMQHKRNQCPARESTCYKCNKKGHFASVYRTKKDVASLEERLEDTHLETAYLNTVDTEDSTA